jgi:phosphoribosylaminoimidazolecarboxamide formyltransferase/IMP cyclohydrolase
VPFAQRLAGLGWELVASGGTARALRDGGLEVTAVESITGNPEAFDGRMKTISFQLESALLYDRKNADHVKQAEALGVTPIDLVACNFYPFRKTVAQPDCTLAQGVEQIDVGGPTMVRAAAKNFQNVIVLVDPSEYDAIADELSKHDGVVSLDTRKRLALRAFCALAEADFEVAAWLAQQSGHAVDDRLLHLHHGEALRYGENPHQSGHFYRVAGPDLDPLALHRFEQTQGKQLSYNNLLDADGALYALSLLGGERPAAVIVKHTNPCGAAYGQDLREAFERAWEGDPLAAFGGIIALNRDVDAAVAQLIVTDRFVEVLLAPGLSDDARGLLASKKNLRVLINAALREPSPPQGFDYRSVRGGMLAQDVDTRPIPQDALAFPTRQRPTAEQMADLRMAWQICRASRSNAVTIVRDGMLVGNGVGQQDRLRSCRIAVDKAGDRTKGAVAASDAFFPFSDGPRVLAQAGVAAIIQPGGSIRDAETFELCDSMAVAMVTTGGQRCFRH